MAVFAISRSSAGGLTASVDGQDVGREVDAAKFHSSAATTGLTSTFGNARDNVQVSAVSATRNTSFKPQGMDV